MSKGEKAELTIEPEWAYGKKGNIDAKYPCLKKLKTVYICSWMCCSRNYPFSSKGGSPPVPLDTNSFIVHENCDCFCLSCNLSA